MSESTTSIESLLSKNLVRALYLMSVGETSALNKLLSYMIGFLNLGFGIHLVKGDVSIIRIYSYSFEELKSKVEKDIERLKQWNKERGEEIEGEINQAEDNNLEKLQRVYINLLRMRQKVFFNRFYNKDQGGRKSKILKIGTAREIHDVFKNNWQRAKSFAQMFPPILRFIPYFLSILIFVPLFVGEVTANFFGRYGALYYDFLKAEHKRENSQDVNEADEKKKITIPENMLYWHLKAAIEDSKTSYTRKRRLKDEWLALTLQSPALAGIVRLSLIHI